MSKVEAPFLIVEWKILNLYKLELPPDIKVRPTFHVSFTKAIKKDTSYDRKQMIRPPPDLVGGHLKYEVRGPLQV